MGVKRGNLKLISGALLSSFILNYIYELGYKKEGWNKKKKRIERKRRESIERERRPRRGKTQSFGKICLLDHESSVEVVYGFHAIRSKLLIANDMC